MADTKKKRPAARPQTRRAPAKGARARQARQRMVIGVAAALALLVLLGILLISRDGDDGGGAIAGLVTFQGKSKNHVTTPVEYPEVPPVGGDHSPVPQTCGAYDQPVRNEHAVHSIEHGAIWITYRPDLPSEQVDRLRDLAGSHVLVSPYPGLPAPVVATAWERQVRLESASDPRLKRFISQFRQGPQAPEATAACRGTGEPLD